MSVFIRSKFKVGFVLILVAVVTVGVLMTGQPVASQDKPSESSWVKRCDEGKENSCEVFQRLVLKETGQRVVEFAIGFPEGKGVARGVVILPLGILLSGGATMKIDEGQAFKFDVRYCTQQGCFAFLNLNKALLDKFRKGSAVAVTFKSLDGKDMNVGLPLIGFTKALKEVSS